MDEIRLPQHIVNRIERRWTTQICADAGRLPKSGGSFARHQLRRPAPSAQVRRLAEGFLEPPTTERALVS